MDWVYSLSPRQKILDYGELLNFDNTQVIAQKKMLLSV
jgi:hypothetical protein